MHLNQAAHTDSVLTCNGFGWPHCQQQLWGIQLYIILDCRHRKLLQQKSAHLRTVVCATLMSFHLFMGIKCYLKNLGKTPLHMQRMAGTVWEILGLGSFFRPKHRTFRASLLSQLHCKDVLPRLLSLCHLSIIPVAAQACVSHSNAQKIKGKKNKNKKKEEEAGLKVEGCFLKARTRF